MKAARYNRIFQAPNGAWLAFNAWTTALAEIEPENLDFLRAILADPDGTPCDTPERQEMREALLLARFLVEDNADERATIKSDLLRDRFSPDTLYLTIAPTLDCNFRCDYCYEERLKINMSRTVEEALVRWVEARSPAARKLYVTWYGGEPLLPQSFGAIERLSERFQALARDRGTEYAADLVTNGSLLDRAKMERLAQLGVATVQLTLDGGPEAHDARRCFPGGRGSFDLILENLKRSVDLAEFHVRVNVDKRNAMSVLEIAEIMRREGLIDKVRPYLAQVVLDGASCGNIQEICYGSREYAEVEIEIYREAIRRGLPMMRYPFRIVGAYCQAEKMNAYVVAPTGELFKCWHEVTMTPEHAIGSVLEEQEPYQKLNEDRWLAWDAFERSGCRECDILPMCHGGCPLLALRGDDPARGACDHYRWHLEPLLELKYAAALADQERQAASAGEPAREAEGAGGEPR